MDMEEYLESPNQYKIIEITGEGKKFWIKNEKLSAEVWWVIKKYKLHWTFTLISFLYFDYQLLTL